MSAVIAKKIEEAVFGSKKTSLPTPLTVSGHDLQTSRQLWSHPPAPSPSLPPSPSLSPSPLLSLSPSPSPFSPSPSPSCESVFSPSYSAPAFPTQPIPNRPIYSPFTSDSHLHDTHTAKHMSQEPASSSSVSTSSFSPSSSLSSSLPSSPSHLYCIFESDLVLSVFSEVAFEESEREGDGEEAREGRPFLQKSEGDSVNRLICSFLRFVCGSNSAALLLNASPSIIPKGLRVFSDRKRKKYLQIHSHSFD